MSSPITDSFDQFRQLLQEHPGLRKAGLERHRAFVDLAERVWVASRGTVVPNCAVKSQKYVPFSPHDRRGHNLADIEIRHGAIRLYLKLHRETLRSADPDLKTIPNQWKASRFRPYPRVFNLRSGDDVEFASRLILACELGKGSGGAGPVQVEPRRAERELDFAFVRDAKLRGVLQSDWKEGQRTYEASAWKSHVIVCGGVVEGLLVDALGRDHVAAAGHYILRPGESRAPQLGRWSLDALVRAALQLRFLSFETACACQTLRSRRNLVHPAQAAIAGIDVTDQIASHAGATVRACYAELQRRFSS